MVSALAPMTPKPTESSAKTTSTGFNTGQTGKNAFSTTSVRQATQANRGTMVKKPLTGNIATPITSIYQK